MNQNKCMVLSEIYIRLNIGCGNDYREGFINIDSRADLPRIDMVINLSKESLLKPGGALEMRLPDFEHICSSAELSMIQKITLLFGGQDIPQGEADPPSRKRYPEFFCHKYAYTQTTMKQELEMIGFKDIITRQEGTNFVVTAVKPSRSA